MDPANFPRNSTSPENIAHDKLHDRPPAEYSRTKGLQLSLSETGAIDLPSFFLFLFFGLGAVWQ